MSVYEPGLSIFLQITQDLNNIKKSRAPLCRHWLVGNMCKILAKNIQLYGRWSSSKFLILKQSTWFLENNEALSNLSKMWDFALLN